MATVQLTATASDRLTQLLTTRELPPSARSRLLSRLEQLERFPESGRQVRADDWSHARVLFGPWWFVIVYTYDAATEAVVVTTIEDARTAAGAALSRD